MTIQRDEHRAEVDSACVRRATHAMGTRFEVVLYGANAAHLHAVAESALGEVELLHARLSKFEPSSTLSLINRDAGARPVRVDADTFSLLETCRDVWQQSHGAFDPSIGARMEALGLHPVVRGSSSPWGFQHVQLDPAARTVRFTVPGVSLDFGAIAKGLALDAAAEVLSEHAITCAFLHGGTSTAIGIGSPPGEAGWRVRVQLGETSRTFTIRDESISVSKPVRSGTIEPSSEVHIIDPATGIPAGGALLAVAVHAQAVMSDAWSTALAVKGRGLSGLPCNMVGYVLDHDGWHDLHCHSQNHPFACTESMSINSPQGVEHVNVGV